jgi:hypothetical protein
MLQGQMKNNILISLLGRLAFWHWLELEWLLLLRTTG